MSETCNKKPSGWCTFFFIWWLLLLLNMYLEWWKIFWIIWWNFCILWDSKTTRTSNIIFIYAFMDQRLFNSSRNLWKIIDTNFDFQKKSVKYLDSLYVVNFLPQNLSQCPPQLNTACSIISPEWVVPPILSLNWQGKCFC